MTTEQTQKHPAESRVRIALVVLSGDRRLAEQQLLSTYPDCSIEIIPRAEIESGSVASRLNAMRSRAADVFAFATENLEWQRRQELFMLLGALAGAKEVVILDPHGGLRKEKRGKVLLRAPARTAAETVFGYNTILRARFELRQLENAVKTRRKIGKKTQLEGGLSVTFLRATPGPGTQAGGAASHIKGVFHALKALGTRVKLISNDTIAGLDDAEICVVRPEPFGGTRAAFEIHNNAVFTNGAVPIIVPDPPDFIYQRYARFGWSGVVASLRTRRPLFLEYNGSEVWVGRQWDRVGMLDLLARYERLNLAAAARIFVVSEVERRNLERAGISPQKIIVNPNAVDTDVFRPGVGGERIRRELQIEPRETLVGFVGSFGPWHGVLTLAAAIKLVPVEKGIKFLLIGSGSLYDEVAERLNHEQQEGRVILAGAVAHDKVAALLDACDVLVSPHVPLADGTEFFGSPTKIFEYMAMGKGIVASRLGQIGEVLENGKTALLIEPENEQQLRDAIVRMAESKELREQLGAGARAAACARHTWTQNAQRVIDAYRQWLNENDG